MPAAGKAGHLTAQVLRQNVEGPLGMRIVKKHTVMASDDKDVDVLVVADAYLGLVAVEGIMPGEMATKTVLAVRASTDPKSSAFMLLDDLVQARDNTIYITELSRSLTCFAHLPCCNGRSRRGTNSSLSLRRGAKRIKGGCGGR